MRPLARRSLFALFATTGAGGFLVGDTASAIAQAGQSGGTQMRTGKVRAFDGQLATVDIGGGTLLGMQYLRSYAPTVGDIVTCLSSSDGAWQCLGDCNAIPPNNAVANPSFDSGLSNWGRYHDPSSTSATTFTTDTTFDPIAGVNVVKIDQSGAAVGHIATDVVYSDPIAVAPGEVWSASAYAQGFADFPDPVATVILLLTWYANNANVYPTTAAPDTTLDQVNVLLAGNTWRRLRTFAGVTVPANAVFMRVALLSQLLPGAVAGDVKVTYDRVVAQKILNIDGSPAA